MQKQFNIVPSREVLFEKFNPEILAENWFLEYLHKCEVFYNMDSNDNTHYFIIDNVILFYIYESKPENKYKNDLEFSEKYKIQIRMNIGFRARWISQFALDLYDINEEHKLFSDFFRKMFFKFINIQIDVPELSFVAVTGSYAFLDYIVESIKTEKEQARQEKSKQLIDDYFLEQTKEQPL